MDDPRFEEVLRRLGEAGPGGVVLQTSEVTVLLRGIESLLEQVEQARNMSLGLQHAAENANNRVEMFRGINADLLQANLSMQVALMAIGVDPAAVVGV